MVNTNMTHEFKHPNYYKKLKASQEKEAISPDESTDSDGRTPVTHPDLLPAHGPEYYAPRRKRRSSSNKQQAGEAQASSYKDSSSK